MRLLCRPLILNGLDRTMRMNTENGLDGSMRINTDSPRLAITPGEWYASEMIRVIPRSKVSLVLVDIEPSFSGVISGY